MKKKLTFAAALLPLIFAACGESESNGGSNGAANTSGIEIPTYKSAEDLPGDCKLLDVSQVDGSYYLCSEGKWVEIGDSAFVQNVKNYDEDNFSRYLDSLLDVIDADKALSSEAESVSSSSENTVTSSSSKVEENSSSSAVEKMSSSSGTVSSSSNTTSSSSKENVSSSSLTRNKAFAFLDPYVQWESAKEGVLNDEVKSLAKIIEGEGYQKADLSSKEKVAAANKTLNLSFTLTEGDEVFAKTVVVEDSLDVGVGKKGSGIIDKGKLRLRDTSVYFIAISKSGKFGTVVKSPSSNKVSSSSTAKSSSSSVPLPSSSSTAKSSSSGVPSSSSSVNVCATLKADTIYTKKDVLSGKPFVCDAGKARLATKSDTTKYDVPKASNCGNGDGNIIQGTLVKSNLYTCESGVVRALTESEKSFGYACTPTIVGTSKVVNKKAKVCYKRGAWRDSTSNEKIMRTLCADDNVGKYKLLGTNWYCDKTVGYDWVDDYRDKGGYKIMSSGEYWYVGIGFQTWAMAFDMKREYKELSGGVCVDRTIHLPEDYRQSEWGSTLAMLPAKEKDINQMLSYLENGKNHDLYNSFIKASTVAEKYTSFDNSIYYVAEFWVDDSYDSNQGTATAFRVFDGIKQIDKGHNPDVKHNVLCVITHHYQ